MPPTAIPGDLAKAIAILCQYPNLKKIVSPVAFEDAVKKKYRNGPEIDMDRGEVFDLFTALLVSVFPSFQQEGQNQATPEGVLLSIDNAINLLPLAVDQAKSLGDKLCNLRTSSLWDTLSE